MGNENFIIVLDKDSSTSRQQIESSTHITARIFSSMNQILELTNTDEVVGVFIDAEFATRDVLAENMQKVREKWGTAPLIVMTQDKNPESISELLHYHFDEFLVKPFNAEDANLRMLVKRMQLGKDEFDRPVTVGDITVDPATRSIKNLTTNKVKFISPIEVNLLCILLGAMGHSISRENVKRKCWGTTAVSDNALNRKLFEVRQALSNVGSEFTIKTLYGSGYAIQTRKASNSSSETP